MWVIAAVLLGVLLLAALFFVWRSKNTGAVQASGARTDRIFEHLPREEPAISRTESKAASSTGPASHSDDADIYHARYDRDVDEHWDPYSSAQSRVSRVQEARRRAREKPMRRAPPPASYYTLLGVDMDASLEQIESAYRRKAAEVHPDRFFSDEARREGAQRLLKELNGAMQIMRDPEQRAAYDRRLQDSWR